MNILLVGINSKFIHMNPAIYSLAAAAGQYSAAVHTAEYTINMPYEEIRGGIYERLASDDKNVLMFSCYIWNIGTVEQLLADFAVISPTTEFWIGGPEVGYRAKDMLKRIPQLTGVFVGEGEHAFREVVRLYAENAIDDRTLAQIPGIAFQSRSAGENAEPVETGIGKMMAAEEIPFWYRDDETGHLKTIFKNRILYYESQRGCPFRCSYCLSSIDKTVRQKTMPQVLSELAFFLKEGVRQVKFIDRTFNCNPTRTVEILQFLKENDNGITNFHFEMEGALLTAEEIRLLQSLRPGLVQLELGVQTTNRETLRAIHRDDRLTRLWDNVKELRKNRNIHLHLDLIAGLPYENLASFQNSFCEVYAQRPDELQLGFLKVLHGTSMEEEAAQYEIRYSQTPPYEVMATKWISFSELLLLKRVEAMLEIYYNSGQFTTTLPILEGMFENPFALYRSLAEFEERTGRAGLSFSRLQRYEILYEFMTEREPEQALRNREVLLYDLYLRENIKSLPKFAENRKSVRISQKGDRNLLHTEEFLYPKPHVVTFDYSKRDAITNNAAVTEEIG